MWLLITHLLLVAATPEHITGNPAVDQAFAGIERASGWTDRALMLGMLVIVLFMCGYFLKMANDEIKRQRQSHQEEVKNLLDRIVKMEENFRSETRELINVTTKVSDLLDRVEWALRNWKDKHHP